MPIDRQVWLEAGHQLRSRRPPPAPVPPADLRRTHDRGLYDERATGVMWAVDSFAALTTGAVYDVADLPPDLRRDVHAFQQHDLTLARGGFTPKVYGRHVDTVEGIGATTIASAHGAVLRGQFIERAFDHVRALAGEPNVPTPGQDHARTLLVAQALVTPTA